jgi:hypothetical protein
MGPRWYKACALLQTGKRNSKWSFFYSRRVNLLHMLLLLARTLNEQHSTSPSQPSKSNSPPNLTQAPQTSQQQATTSYSSPPKATPPHPRIAGPPCQATPLPRPASRKGPPSLPTGRLRGWAVGGRGRGCRRRVGRRIFVLVCLDRLLWRRRWSGLG